VNEPTVTGPTAFNLAHPESFTWESAVSGWSFNVTGAGDSTYNGTYLARSDSDAKSGIYRHTARDDRYLNWLDSGGSYWSMGASRVTSMPGAYFRSGGTITEGPADGQWSVGNGSSPAPTVTKTTRSLTGVFRFQIVPDGEDADPGEWSDPSEETSFLPEGLTNGDYRLLVQEWIDEDEWTGAGIFPFSVSTYLLAGPAINGPAIVNATYARFSWRTAKPLGWMFTVTGAGESTYNGTYLAEDAAAGVYRHTVRTDRWLNYLNSSGTHYWSMGSSRVTFMPGFYYCTGTLESGPTGTWFVGNGFSPAPTVTREDLPGLTGLYQWQVTEDAEPSPDGWSETSAAMSVEQTGLVPGEYRLFVREHVAGDEWTETGGFTYSVTANPIPAPVISATTPTDNFTPAFTIRSDAPGPERILVRGAGTAVANGNYIPDGMLNGYPCYVKADGGVWCWNVPDYSSRMWIIASSANRPAETTGSFHSGAYWYRVYSSANPPPASGWSVSSGAASAPTLQFGSYVEGGGTGEFQFRVNGGEWSETFQEASFVLPEQASGIHAVEAREMGENGVWGQAATFNIETSLIAAPTITGPAESNGGWHATFTWAATSGNRGTRAFRYRMNNGPWSVERAGANTGNTATTVAQLLDGYNAFEVQEKSTTGGWSVIGLHEVLASNALSGVSDLPVPPGARIVIMDAAGREYLWGPEAGQISRQYEPLLMRTTDGARYLFVTARDKYHLPTCPSGATGILLTVPELIAREAIPCGRCRPPALS